MANENTVTLTLSSYNQIKSENFRLNLFVDNLINEATIGEDGKLVLNTDSIEYALRLCCWDRYKKKLYKGGNQDADLPQASV